MAMSYNTSLVNVVNIYLEKLQVKVTRNTILKELEQNPYYPSLYSISAVLNKFNINNEAFTLEAKHLDELRTPFIAFCNNTAVGKDFVLVTSVSANSVTYLSNKKDEKTVTKETFIRDWEKIVLIAEPDAVSGEAGYAQNAKKEKVLTRKKQLLWLAVFIIVAVSIFSVFVNLDSRIFSSAVFISFTKLFGTAITILLLIYETDKSNSFVKNLCTMGKQTDCDAVLNSKASGIAGVKWSEAGFFYFAASTLFLFYPSVSFAAKIPWLAIGATTVAPYILFSLYYQYKVVKQWCPLCLATQAVLLLELMWAIIFYWQNPVMPLLNTMLIAAGVISILLPVTAWFVIKPLIKESKNAGQYEAAYKRLLYNPEQFYQLLQQQGQAPDGWQQLGITIGNPAAANTILKICNPYCGPCAKAHPELEAIVHANANINLKIIFTATNRENDRSAKPVKHLLAIAANNNGVQTQQALDDWYSADKKDYEAFAVKYPMNGELKKQDEKIDNMHNWCNEAGIVATPTIFVNGHSLPENYEISELKNIL